MSTAPDTLGKSPSSVHTLQNYASQVSEEGATALNLAPLWRRGRHLGALLARTYRAREQPVGCSILLLHLARVSMPRVDSSPPQELRATGVCRLATTEQSAAIPALAEAPLEETSLPLEQQVVRLQALLEASRAVHSTIELPRVLEQAARIAVLELELDGAYFTQPYAGFGRIPAEPGLVTPGAVNIPLLARDGSVLSEFVLLPGEGQQLALYERDFLEGLALQTALAVENALHHQRRLEWARLEQDLDAARTIQRSLLPQTLPILPGYSLAARSSACYQVGGDYLDIVSDRDGSQLIVVADVAGKGLASAIVCTSFRSAFRALAREALPMEELACRLGQQHWDEGEESRRRYVTAIFMRLHPRSGALEFVNAGHNPACLLAPGLAAQTIAASGPPLGLLPGCRYKAERATLAPGGRVLLYTDGLTEVFQQEEEFGSDRLFEALASLGDRSADEALAAIWTTLAEFSGGAPQVDDMSAVAVYRLAGKEGA